MDSLTNEQAKLISELESQHRQRNAENADKKNFGVYICHAFGRYSLRSRFDDSVIYSSKEKTTIEESFRLGASKAKELGLILV